jgi:DNA polymerase (family 10)
MDAVLKAAAETHTALEINAHPMRLDLDDPNARRARDMGIALAIDTDSHNESDFDVLFYGIATARRAWLKKEDVINTWPVERLLNWLKDRK